MIQRKLLDDPDLVAVTFIILKVTIVFSTQNPAMHMKNPTAFG